MEGRGGGRKRKEVGGDEGKNVVFISFLHACHMLSKKLTFSYLVISRTRMKREGGRVYTRKYKRERERER